MLRAAQTVDAAPGRLAGSLGAAPDGPQSSEPGDQAVLKQKPVVLDVRNAYEWDAGHFEGAHRPLEDAFNETPREAENGEPALPDALKEASPDTPVMVRLTPSIC
jgi:rhodanese-related sulfurtransferase